MWSDFRYTFDVIPAAAARAASGRSCIGLLAACGLIGVVCWGPARAALPDELSACRTIAEDSRRLACYDSLSHQAAAVPATVAPAAAAIAAPSAVVPSTTAPAAAAPAAAASAATVEQGFGSELVNRRINEGPQSLKGEVVGEIDGIKRHARFRLNNGQIWESVDDNEYEYEGENPRVSIDRNFAGSYWMHLDKAHFNLRVNRVE
ncbi:MAG: hypothetical protein JWR07_4800 [Nevskia sp.]|nr:hypothetical protein [Nevskia sp.]